MTDFAPTVIGFAAGVVVRRHIVEHDVPYNPLHDLGYPSIGCRPCTSPVLPGEDDRPGRWRGSARTECGLHGRATVSH